MKKRLEITCIDKAPEKDRSVVLICGSSPVSAMSRALQHASEIPFKPLIIDYPVGPILSEEAKERLSAQPIQDMWDQLMKDVSRYNIKIKLPKSPIDERFELPIDFPKNTDTGMEKDG